MDDTTVVLTRHKLDVHDYHRMGEAGILGEDDRVELIDGELIDMAAIGVGHASVVTRINKALVLAAGDRALVSVQNPVRLDEFNEPQPDFAVLLPRHDFYGTRHPGPSDVLLLVEVADSSLQFDRIVKLPLYARFGIAEVWIVDLKGRTLETNRSPGDGHYGQVSTHGPGEILTLSAAPDITVRMDQVFG